MGHLYCNDLILGFSNTNWLSGFTQEDCDEYYLKCSQTQNLAAKLCRDPVLFMAHWYTTTQWLRQQPWSVQTRDPTNNRLLEHSKHWMNECRGLLTLGFIPVNSSFHTVAQYTGTQGTIQSIQVSWSNICPHSSTRGTFRLFSIGFFKIFFSNNCPTELSPALTKSVVYMQFELTELIDSHKVLNKCHI